MRVTQWLTLKRRTIPLLCVIVVASIYTLTFISQRSSGSHRNKNGNGNAQRTIRSLRKRATNESAAMSSVEGTTMADLLTEQTTGGGEVTGPTPAPDPVTQANTAKLQKISIRDQFRPFKLPEKYSKNVVPSPQAAIIHTIDNSEELEKYKEGITPVKIAVGVKLEGVSVQELDEELVLSLQLFLRWDDAFIRIDNNKDTKLVNASSPDNFRTMDPSFADEIWKPDLFLENLVKVKQPKLISPLVTLNINPYTGTIVYISRMLIKVTCGMDFRYYPTDTQRCDIRLRSNSYTHTQIQLKWENVILLDTSEPNFYVQLSDFDSYLHIEEFVGYSYKQISTLQFTILAKRKISYHMVQSYIPSVFFVLITWMCFLIPAKSVEVRIGIAMTTLLTLTAMFASIRESTPIVSYVKAIDIWMVFCIFFVFGTLLEFAIIIYLQGYAEYLKDKETAHYEEENKKLNSTTPTTGDGNEEIELKAVPEANGDLGRDNPLELSRKARYFIFMVEFIEKYAFLGFAISFFIFNIAYWWWLFASSDWFEWKVEEDLNEL